MELLGSPKHVIDLVNGRPAECAAYQCISSSALNKRRFPVPPEAAYPRNLSTPVSHYLSFIASEAILASGESR
jgi:hypothetical protein